MRPKSPIATVGQSSEQPVTAGTTLVSAHRIAAAHANCMKPFRSYQSIVGSCEGRTTRRKHAGAVGLGLDRSREIAFNGGGNSWAWCNDWHVCDLGNTAETVPLGRRAGPTASFAAAVGSELSLTERRPM